MVERYADF
uniref:Uncharacterized protein n=1 Tax=Anguilla anguilla TaxID=7936 RepID=A0A0E9TGH7_ANGAN